MKTDTETTDDERRWGEAEAILNQSGDPVVARAVKRRRTRTWLLLVAAVVVSLLIAGVLGFVLAGSASDTGTAADDSDPLWAVVLVLAALTFGAGLIVMGIVRLARDGQWGARWRAPTSVLTRSQRKQLRRQVVGQQPVDPAHLPLARDLAERTTRMTGLMMIFAGTAITQLGQAVTASRPWQQGVAASAVVMIAAAALAMRRDTRRARRFLTDHPAQ